LKFDEKEKFETLLVCVVVVGIELRCSSLRVSGVVI